MTRRTGGRLLLMAAAAVGVAQCDRNRGETPAPTEAPVPAVTPAVQTSLTRADLVAALAQAASAYAAGTEVSNDDAIAGRTFEIRLPFGCLGPRPADGITGEAGWSRTADGGIDLTLTPADWSRSPLVLASGAPAPDWDGVEGFWIPRPWLSAETCPRAPSTSLALSSPQSPSPPVAASSTRASAQIDRIETLRPLPSPPSPMTAGLAVIQDADASRLGRRPGEPYRFTLRGDGGTPVAPPTDGYRLVLAGRIGRFPDGRAVRCTSDSPDRRPACVAAVDLDLVAFEDATGNRLSEWRPT